MNLWSVFCLEQSFNVIVILIVLIRDLFCFDLCNLQVLLLKGIELFFIHKYLTFFKLLNRIEAFRMLHKFGLFLSADGRFTFIALDQWFFCLRLLLRMILILVYLTWIIS
jgi:hypothetical protein